MIVKDGEGASKLIAIEVKGARNEKDAGTAAFAVANSNLVKTAVYGNDPNWGRILAALGYSGATVKEENIDVFFGKLKVVNRGVTTGRDEEAAGIMKEKELKITINLNLGKASFNVLTCDLTEEYVKENATYKT
jgi:glutamate N-acetyltransferase/amino-acid N-acetyltransferase